MNEEELLKNRICDLAEQCYNRDVPTHTEFLNLFEQDLFCRTVGKLPGIRYFLYGGYEMAERKVGIFLPSYAEDEDPSCFPASYVKISPLNEKFAEPLTHRDFLGALLNLGMDRGKIGDLLVDGSSCVLLCMEELADFICHELTRVRHTSVCCERLMELPEAFGTPKTERKEGTVASVRLDAVVALAFGLSRSKAVPLIEGGQVFVNGRLTESGSAPLKEEDLVSVRHMGRFRFLGVQNATRKGRAFVAVERFV